VIAGHAQEVSDNSNNCAICATTTMMNFLMIILLFGPFRCRRLGLGSDETIHTGHSLIGGRLWKNRYHHVSIKHGVALFALKSLKAISVIGRGQQKIDGG
jgi:hypothetical protein